MRTPPRWTPFALAALIGGAPAPAPAVTPASHASHSPAPLACDLGALTPVERTRLDALHQRLREKRRGVRERRDGWAFTLPADAATLAEARELVALEGRCCPFMRMALSQRRGSATLTVSGGADVKAFIAASGMLDPVR